MIALKQILCLSYLPWQARPNRTQQLLSRLSDVQVLFFEPPAPKGAAPEQGRRVRSHITVYTLPAPLLPRLSRPSLLPRNQSKAVDFVQGVMARHKFRDPVLWCTCPDQAVYLDWLAYRGLIYDCHREWGEEYLDQESDLVCHAEVVFAASPGLVQRLSPCSDNIALLPNGVNPRMFQQSQPMVPAGLADLKGRKVFARVGDWTRHVELEPLLAAAKAHPEWMFLLIGPITRPLAEQLGQMPNVVLTGPVNAVELPDYHSLSCVLFDLNRRDLQGSDIISPRIYEYLATGKPIVLMGEPGEPEVFPDLVYTATNPSEFLQRLELALMEPPELAVTRRLSFAQQSSWANRAMEVNRILESTGLF